MSRLCVFGVLSFTILLITPFKSLTQCVSGNCQNGEGEYRYPSGARYIGSFANYLAHGFGTLHFANGDIYKGEWKKHKRDGEGTFVSEDNLLYKGEFKNNQFHGNGELIYASKSSYKGQFQNGKFHGHGTFKSSDGQVTDGEWVAGLPKNECQPEPVTLGRTMEHPTGDLLDCNKLRCHDEVGRFVYRDGTVYTGSFFNGQPEGSGKVEYVNGDVYTGGWKNHAPSGEGVVRYMNGRTYGAIWDNGRPVKELEADHPLTMETVEVQNDEETKIWAVIIGVSRYNHMPTLKYTDDDAFHLYAFLKSPEGGAIPDEQITLLIDEQANRKEIISKLQQTFYKADENDVVLLYYSGHGLEGKMIPSDFDGYNNAVKYGDIKNIVNQSRAQHKIVITDACHSGSMLASRNLGMSQLKDFYKTLSETPNGIAFMTSSRGEEVSLESSGLRHGIFSHFLILGLRGKADVDRNNIVSLQELFTYVQLEVRSYTNHAQNPLIFGNFDPNIPLAIVRN